MVFQSHVGKGPANRSLVDESLPGWATETVSNLHDTFTYRASREARSRKLPPFSGDFVGSCRHIAHTRGVNPFIVEIEECAHGDGIVQRLLAPARSPYLVYVFLLKPTGLPIHFLDERKQCLLRSLTGAVR